MSITANQVSIKGEQTRERIKKCARELFAQHGVEKVTIRDIARVVGQNNGGSINYHFGSKDKLIIEILADVGRAADRRRGVMLDRLEASGQPITIRQILRVLTRLQTQRDRPMIRLFVMLELYHRDIVYAIRDEYKHRSVQRCMTHFSALLPDMPREILEQRVNIILGCAWLFIATREDETESFRTRFSNTPSAFENLLDGAEGILVQPPSEETLAALRAENRPKKLSAKNAA